MQSISSPTPYTSRETRATPETARTISPFLFTPRLFIPPSLKPPSMERKRSSHFRACPASWAHHMQARSGGMRSVGSGPFRRQSVQPAVCSASGPLCRAARSAGGLFYRRPVLQAACSTGGLFRGRCGSRASNTEGVVSLSPAVARFGATLGKLKTTPQP